MFIKNLVLHWGYLKVDEYLIVLAKNDISQNKYKKTARMHKLISKTVLLPPFWNALVLLTYDQALYNGHKLKITKSSKGKTFFFCLSQT